MAKYRWMIVVVIILASLLLWIQTINVMCDDDIQMFNGICVINKYIPW